MNRNAMFAGGIRPHHYCLPVLKRERDREALLEAATGDDPRFFLGTDSAPHARHTKEAACGCAGIFSAHAAIELYAEAFEAAGRLDRLEAFAAELGADFYGLPRNAGRITLERASLDGAGRAIRSATTSSCRCAPATRSRWRLVTGVTRSRDDADRIAGRFRGFLPVVVDVETGGFNAATDALLEIAAVLIEMTPRRRAAPGRDASATTCSRSTARASTRRRSRSTASTRTTRCGRRCRRRKR